MEDFLLSSVAVIMFTGSLMYMMWLAFQIPDDNVLLNMRDEL